MPDFDAFEDFDDAYAYDDLGAGFEADGLGPLGEAAPRGASPAAARAARVLVEGETGVAFDALVLFAEPLFALYDLDVADAFALKADPDAAPPEVLAVLETARVLWAFFSLPPAQRAHRRNALAAQLVGPRPTEEDWLDIDGLLDTVEPYWKAMLPEERRRAEQTGSPVLDFEALLEHPASTSTAPTAPAPTAPRPSPRSRRARSSPSPSSTTPPRSPTPRPSSARWTAPTPTGPSR
jgi:hypothetical protein